VAVYFLNMKTFGRANGSSAASAVAYRAGERIRDERTGKTYDHSERQDVMHKEIVLPSKFAADEMAWARDRARLWNAAENSETRKNARVAREYLVALPVELSPPQRLKLVRGFSQELSDRYGFAVDFTIHAPRDFPGSDPRTAPPAAHPAARIAQRSLDAQGSHREPLPPIPPAPFDMERHG
jgi:ATP-dependent exoDNAse (exonuclease V) alpha subunit